MTYRAIRLSEHPTSDRRVARPDKHEVACVAEVDANGIKQVLFVCAADICRSPMAAAILNALAEDCDLPLRAESAGVAALVGREMDPKSIVALEGLGVYPEAHRARNVERAMVEAADLELAMGPRHVARIERFFEGLPEKVHVLPAFVVGAPVSEEVRDPYGHTMIAHRATARQLLGYAEHLLAYLYG